MSIRDVLKKSFVEGYASMDLELTEVVVCMLCTVLIATYIYVIYKSIMRKSFYNRNFNLSLITLAVITAAIAAASENESTDGLVVRSIVRRY